MIIRLILRRGQLRQRGSSPKVVGRSGGEQPGVSGRSLSRTGFSALVRSQPETEEALSPSCKRNVVLLAQKYSLVGIVASHNGLFLERETHLKHVFPNSNIPCSLQMQPAPQNKNSSIFWFSNPNTTCFKSLFSFQYNSFSEGCWGTVQAGCLQWRAPCLNKWSERAWCQLLPSDKHSQCSLTCPQAAGAYLRAELGLQSCCFGYFAIPAQKWIFSSQFSATNQSAGKWSLVGLSVMTFNYQAVLGFSSFTAGI